MIKNYSLIKKVNYFNVKNFSNDFNHLLVINLVNINESVC
jgi:hypothetical protein